MKLLIILNLLISSACASSVKEVKKTEEIVTTFECFASDTKLFSDKISAGESLSGKKVLCQAKNLTVDTYVIHGPDEIIILNLDSGKWENFKISECGIIHD